MGRLQQQISVGTKIANTRLVLPPMATEGAEDGKVTKKIVDHYAQFTKGGYFGIVVTGHTYVSDDGKYSEGQVSSAHDDDVEGLAKVAEAVHANGSLVLLQLNHCGSAGDMKLTGHDLIAPSPALNMSPSAKTRLHARAMTVEDIDRVKHDFIDAAYRAKEAGYDGVELHAAHGFLLNEFYSPLANKRNDLYTGKNMVGRTRLQIDIISGIREVCGTDFIISMRFGACDYKLGGSLDTEAVIAAQYYFEAGLDLISISGGMCGFIHPQKKEPGYFGAVAQMIRSSVHIPLILTGGIKTPEDAEALLENGNADMIGVGRAVMADPDWARRAIEEY
jgi:NADPH2 dehydrogenase